jgi:TRAP-type C4-dicarboxylate transport system substrate-binding protein
VDEMKMHSRWAVTVVAALLSLGPVACAAPAGRGVGSQPASVVLSLANGNHGSEMLLPFVEAAAAATGGTVTIEVEDEVHIGEPDYETAIINDVAAGTYDLGWVAPRPWHEKGVMSFDALMAPFLVDSYGLQRAVLESDLEQQMLAGLEGTGLVGIGIMPGPLRRFATLDDAVRRAADLKGKLVGIGDSDVARMTFAALGAETRTLPSGGSIDGLDAVEQQLGSIVGNRYHLDLPHVTADVALWPRPVILFANKASFDRLSADQQAALRGVTKQILSTANADVEAEDAAALATMCADGSDIVVAGDDAGADLREAVASVHDELSKNPSTAAMIRQILTMKAGTPADASFAGCKTQPPSEAPVAAGGFPDGTYEARLSCDDLGAYWADHPELPIEDRFPCPFLMSFTLENGTWVENYGARWTYSFFGDHVQLGNFTLRWSWDGTHLTFSEIVGGDPGDEQAWTTRPFVKVDGPEVPVVGIPDGTYRAEISAAEMEAYWETNDVPIGQREPCPCAPDFTLADGVWIGGDGSEWEPSFFGDKLTLTDSLGSFTLRWTFDPQIEEVTFLDVEAGGGDEELALSTYFLVKPFDRQAP